jgi:hypothetical protein
LIEKELFESLPKMLQNGNIPGEYN